MAPGAVYISGNDEGGARWIKRPQGCLTEVVRPAASRSGRGESMSHRASLPPSCGECGLALRWEQIPGGCPERWLAVCACGMPWAFLPGRPDYGPGRPADGGARRWPQPHRRVAAVDPGLPADLGLPVVAPLEACRARLPGLRAAREVRGLDEAAARPLRVLDPLPRLWPGDQRVRVCHEPRHERGATLGEPVEPAVCRSRAPAPGRLRRSLGRMRSQGPREFGRSCRRCRAS
jgi:hypothetical protein